MQQLSDVKQRARDIWALGDYDAMMRLEGLYEVGARLVRRLEVGAADAVLDVACGTGNATIPAAQTGARVTGLDLTPLMLEVGRRRAEAAGVAIEWQEGDAEAMPFEADRFDVVLSTFGCMFAPRHEVVADEIARVLRPGGRVGLCAWTADGVIGDFFRTVAAYLPPDPEFVDPPLAWGDESTVAELFEGTGLALEFERETWTIEHRSPEQAIECYTTDLGPVVQARRFAEADGRWPQLRANLLELFHAHTDASASRVRLPADYLLVFGHDPR